MNMNSGYSGWSKSVRAERAEGEGKLPLSRIGRNVWIKEAASILGSTEAHHTSKFCNLVDFYDARAVLALAKRLKLLASTPVGARRRIQAIRDARRKSVRRQMTPRQVTLCDARLYNTIARENIAHAETWPVDNPHCAYYYEKYMLEAALAEDKARQAVRRARGGKFDNP